MRRINRSPLGFTLVEVIVTIVILGIVASFVAIFIRAPVQGYRDSVARAELADIADTVLRRMARDIRLALPNSVRTSADGTSIEMLSTRTGGRYLSADDGAGAGVPVLDFIDDDKLSFTFVGDVPSGKSAITPGDRIVVYNLGPGFGSADAYSGGNSALVTSVDSANNVVNMASNPFATQTPPMPSPTARFHVVSGPVMYRCMPGAGGTGTLTRSSGYTINPALIAPVSGGVTALAANRVAACQFQVLNLGSTRAALVVLTLTLQIPGGTDGPLRLTQQVHVDNTP